MTATPPSLIVDGVRRAGEALSGQPTSACPVIAAFLRTWNDDLAADDRDGIVLPPQPFGVSARVEGLEERRGLMIADWMIRIQAVAWLRLAQAYTDADSLARLPEIVTPTMRAEALGAIKAARRAAIRVRDGVWATPARSTQGAPFPSEAWRAPWVSASEGTVEMAEALRETASALAGAALDAARAAIWATPSLREQADVWNAVYETAHAAAHAAVGLGGPTALRTTRAALRRSAARLIARMIDARHSPDA